MTNEFKVGDMVRVTGSVSIPDGEYPIVDVDVSDTNQPIRIRVNDDRCAWPMKQRIEPVTPAEPDDWHPTKNKIVQGELTPEQAKALKEWPHGLLFMGVETGQWHTIRNDGRINPGYTYRAKPAPERVGLLVNWCEEAGVIGWHDNEKAKQLLSGLAGHAFRLSFNPDGTDLTAELITKDDLK